MSGSVQLGPLALAVAPLLAMAAFALASFTARRLEPALARGVEAQLLRTLLVGLLAARAAFVLEFHDAYLKSPLSILDIRDGGWHAATGAGAALAYALAILARRPALRRAFAVSLLVGATSWLAGALVLSSKDAGDVRMPAIALPSMDGTTAALSRFEGRPTVVNLWATWCPPCRREMPVLQEAQRSHPDVNFVFVNQGESAAQVAAYLARNGLELRNVLLDRRGEAAAALGHRALPTTLFFDARGRLVDTRLGELSEASLAHRLASLPRSTSER